MQDVQRRTIRGLIGLLTANRYEVYERPNELNIVGVRNSSTIPNKFDDTIYVFWKNGDGKWVGKYYSATTDTGTYWLKNPMNPQGSALLKNGQYVDAYGIGNHRGYTALVQKKPVTVIRDYNRDDILDFNNGKESTGLFGINIHRANKTGKTYSIDRYSAGCQVFQDADDFNNFMQLAELHKSKYGNNFTYTLIDERAFKKAVMRNGVYLIAGTISILGFIFLYNKYLKK